MLVYRITQDKFANDLSGFGAKLYGGRWNSIGVPMLYTSWSVSLAVLEILVHLPKHLLPKNIVVVTIEIPDILTQNLLKEDILPKNWRQFPAPISTQKIGDSWVKNNTNLCLQVPSTIIINETNVLINTNSVQFKKVKLIDVKPFTLDVRLFK